MRIRERIIEKLTAGLAPSVLEVVDDSERHAGHSGAREGGQTHWRVRVVSGRFAGLNRLARHRLVNDLLTEEFADRIHALALRAEAPGEDRPA